MKVEFYKLAKSVLSHPELAHNVQVDLMNGFPVVEYYDAFVVQKTEVFKLFSSGEKKYLKLGELFGDDVFLDVKIGILFRYDVDGLQFLNSSVQDFSFFVIKYIAFLDIHQGAATNETLVDLDKMWNLFLGKDKRVGEMDSFWNIFIEDVKSVILSEI